MVRRLALGTVLAVVLVLVLVSGSTPATAGFPACTIDGTQGDDVFDEASQTPGTDVVCGLGGNDIFEWSAGDDTYIGGDGNDRVSYAEAPLPCEGCFGLSALLWDDEAYLGEERDLIPEIEELEGSPWRDYLEDNPGEPNVLLGRGGSDTLNFGGEGDRVLGNGGPDILWWRWTGRITIPELVSGNKGKDRIATYASQQGVTIDLEAGTLDGPEVHASLISVEHAQGTRYADTLIGDGQNNLLRGGVGNDTLFGAAGNDRLIGGTQVDSADGGDGTDTCEAETVSNCE